jgi:hypothetical protein
MATNKVEFKIRVKPEVKADMDLLYKSICAIVNQDKTRKWRVVSFSDYWEIVFKEHLAENSDYLRILKNKQNKNQNLE